MGGSTYTIIMLNRWDVVTAETNRFMRGHAEPVRQGRRTCTQSCLHRGPNLPQPSPSMCLALVVCAHLLAVSTANLTLSLHVVPPASHPLLISSYPGYWCLHLTGIPDFRVYDIRAYIEPFWARAFIRTRHLSRVSVGPLLAIVCYRAILFVPFVL